jgi:hypothetical protein
MRGFIDVIKTYWLLLAMMIVPAIAYFLIKTYTDLY